MDSPRPRVWRWRLLILGLLAVVAVGALVPGQTVAWDGRFEDAEYRLRFVDPAGCPVPGVTLRVLTKAGGVCHLYPVNEFLPDSTPTSDADGRMVFHHRARFLEFGGRGHMTLLGVNLTAAGAPQYELVFALRGRDVHRVRYDDLRPRRREDHWTVIRAWRQSDWPARENLARRDEEWAARRLRLFDGDRNGELDREERTAAGYFEDVMTEGLDPRPEPREVTFLVVERTVTIAAPD